MTRKKNQTNKPSITFIKEKRTLTQLQKLVGGYIEMHTLDDGRQMIMNEDAKMMQMPVNTVATRMLPNRLYGNTVVGDVIILSEDGLLD